MLPEHIDGNKPAALQNVRPGTVVDRGVMNAGLTEFLLVAHKALQVNINFEKSYKHK